MSTCSPDFELGGDDVSFAIKSFAILIVTVTQHNVAKNPFPQTICAILTQKAKINFAFKIFLNGESLNGT